MKTILALSFFCCFALLQKVAAQVAATDTASAAQPAKPDPRAERRHAILSRAPGLAPMGPWRDRRPGLLPMNAPFPGQPASRALYDSRRFKLPKDLIPKVRDGEIAAASDYFKPTAASTPAPELLADSAYVKDYRFYAYNRGIRQMKHPVGTGLIIGGGILVAVAVFAGIVIELSHIHIHVPA